MSAREFLPEELERLDIPAATTSLDGDTVVRNIARRYGITVEKLRGYDRRRPVPTIRREVFRQLRAIGWSYPRIGAFMGGRDHSTIVYALSGRRGR